MQKEHENILEEREHTQDSTGGFVKRSERLRLDRECLLALDLRPCATEVCRRVVYRGKAMWLDSRAYAIFLEGLKSNAAVYTVETHEKILKQAPRSVRRLGSIQVSQNPPSLEINGKDGGSNDPVDVTGSGTYYISRSTSRNILDLGYFEKRFHNRIKHKIPVLVVRGDKTIQAETRDISFSGMQIRTREPVSIPAGEKVAIRIPSVGPRVGDSPDELVYEVTGTKILLDATFVSLARHQPVSNTLTDYLREIILAKKTSAPAVSNNNVDCEDAFLTSRALLAERYYLRSTSVIPFFLFRTPSRNGPIKILFSNQTNQQAFKAFEILPGQLDYHDLVTRSRLRLLVQLARRESQLEALLAVFRLDTRSRPVTKIDLEFRNKKEWHQLLTAHINSPNFRVFKISAYRASRPSFLRISSDLDALATQSDEVAEQLLREAEDLVIVGALTDVTAQVRTWHLERSRNVDTERLAPARGNERDRPLPPPEVYPVSYVEEHRREPRFLKTMNVEITWNEVRHTGQTRDISTHGLAVTTGKKGILFQRGSRVLVSFPGLKALYQRGNRVSSPFDDVPYEIVSIGDGPEPLLHMKVCSGKSARRFTELLSTYIETRKARLPLELSHSLRSAATRLYASIFVASSPTVPVFVFQNNREDRAFLTIGLVRSPNSLVKFFETAEGQYDFGVFGDMDRLKMLLADVYIAGLGEMTFFLYKEPVPNTDSFRIRSLSGPELGNAERRREFISRAVTYDFRCVKLVASQPHTPPAPEIEQAVERLHNLSESRALQLRAEFSKLIAVGDIVDITGQIAEVQPYPAGVV